jgi:DNA gyrase subunit A
MAIRFKEDDARPMGRNTSGVKGINLLPDDRLVGMVVADPDATLLTTCLNGYGKRTWFGPNSAEPGDEAPEEDASSSNRYRTQRRGGKGVRDIKTTKRNGPVIGITRVSDDDEILMMTSRGKIQRVRVAEISVIGRNTQGVRIMSLDEDDTLTAVVRVPVEETNGEEEAIGEPTLGGSAAPLPSPRPDGSLPDELLLEEDDDLDDDELEDEIEDELTDDVGDDEISDDESGGDEEE